ncbi:uncharacterized protein [Halyomorpha halys]|uniref:uncharacterized protein n=1 Tax=Halyomorpha halys TaxID=286706 RepID=UPI0006D4F261|nr:uncharacterized protein LOC106685003 [Halyomorpha halys]
MSEKRSNLGTAGLVVAGGAILGAACYAAYEMFKESSFFRSEQPTPVSNNSQQRQSSPGENRYCPICQRGYSENPFELPCGHHFHKICLKANRILHLDREEYKCPICQIPVPFDTLSELDD